MIKIQDSREYQQIIQSEPIVILQFGTEKCMPCHAIRNKLEEWCREREQIQYGYVSVEENPDLAAEQGIFTVPALIVYVEGRKTVKESGYFSLEKVMDEIERYSRLLEI